MIESTPKLTKAQAEALRLCLANYAQTVVTREEYEAASPFHRERYRNGFDAQGQPILRKRRTHMHRPMALQLQNLGLVRVVAVSTNNNVFVRPTSRAIAAEEQRAQAAAIEGHWAGVPAHERD